MELTLVPFNTPGKIFRSAMPYSGYDPQGMLIPAYKENNISMIVMLASDEEAVEIAGRNLTRIYVTEGFEVIHLPIQDFGIPELSKIRDVIPLVTSHSESGGNVVIHCHAGVGRTGMFLACLAKIGMGYSPEDAINWIREFIPGAIEIPDQERLVSMV
jgi:protein-tyrosine phosphatase